MFGFGAKARGNPCDTPDGDGEARLGTLEQFSRRCALLSRRKLVHAIIGIDVRRMFDEKAAGPFRGSATIRDQSAAKPIEITDAVLNIPVDPNGSALHGLQQ